MPIDRKVLLSRVKPEIADAVARTAARLGVTVNDYVGDAVVRAMKDDADKFSLSNARHEHEVARLLTLANEVDSAKRGL